MKTTSRDVKATFGALADTLASCDAALIAARADIYLADQADDYLKLADALLAIRKALYTADKPLQYLAHV